MKNENSLSIVEQQSESMGILAPALLEASKEYARTLWKSGFLPKFYKDQGEKGIDSIVIALQYGAQVGFKGLTALQNISIINGMPSFKGDAAKSLIKTSGLVESWKEYYEGEEYSDEWKHVIEVKRKGEALIKSTFSVKDAKRAGLWIEDSAPENLRKHAPWYKYPKRMLAYRNLGYVARDVFPDVMQGAVTDDEARDFPEGSVILTDQEGNLLDVKTKNTARTNKAIESALKKVKTPSSEAVEVVDEVVEETPVHKLTPAMGKFEEEPVKEELESGGVKEEVPTMEETHTEEEEVVTQDPPLEEEDGLTWNPDWKVYSEKELMDLGDAKAVAKIVGERGLENMVPTEGKNTNMKYRKVVLKHQEMCKPLIDAPDLKATNEPINIDAKSTEEKKETSEDKETPKVTLDSSEEAIEIVTALGVEDASKDEPRDFPGMRDVWDLLGEDGDCEISESNAQEIISTLGLPYKNKEDLCQHCSIQHLTTFVTVVLSR